MNILQTLRLQLRDFTPQDADALALVLSDPETMRYYPAPIDHAGVEQWIEGNRQRYQDDDGVGLWAMELNKTKELATAASSCSRLKASASTKSDTICAATSGGRVWRPKPPSPAVTGHSRI